MNFLKMDISILETLALILIGIIKLKNEIYINLKCVILFILFINLLLIFYLFI